MRFLLAVPNNFRIGEIQTRLHPCLDRLSKKLDMFSVNRDLKPVFFCTLVSRVKSRSCTASRLRLAVELTPLSSNHMP